MPVLWIVIGGALGALARYGVGLLLRSSSEAPAGAALGFPWATFCVNVLGCAAIGGLLGLGDPRTWLSPSGRGLWVTGFLGAFTTFSAFGYETLQLMDRGQGGMALLYVVGSLLVSAFALMVAAGAVKAFV